MHGFIVNICLFMFIVHLFITTWFIINITHVTCVLVLSVVHLFCAILVVLYLNNGQ